MTKEIYDKARAYALHKNSFGTVQDVYSKVYNTVSIMKCFYKLYPSIKREGHFLGIIYRFALYNDIFTDNFDNLWLLLFLAMEHSNSQVLWH